MSYSQRMPVPSSPGLPPSLYSGMSSLQISQAGPGSVARSSYHPFTSQPQKAMLKGPKAARHQSRRNEHSSSSTPWKDPREAAAASAGRRRSVKDDALFRQGQTMWTPLPPDARPTTRDEGTMVMRKMIDHLKEEEAHARFITEANRELAIARERLVSQGRRQQECGEVMDQNYRDLEAIWLKLLQMSPDEEFRQECQNNLNTYYKMGRDMGL